MALVLPSLYSELEGEALTTILQEIKKVNYLRQIVITMGQTTYEQFQHAREFFGVLPQKHTLIWNDGPRIQAFYKQLEEENISAGPMGRVVTYGLPSGMCWPAWTVMASWSMTAIFSPMTGTCWGG